MKRNMIKRIAAVAMAGAMMVSMSVPAMAEELGTKIEFEKKLAMEEYVYVPNTSYSFTVRAAQNSECTPVNKHSVEPGDVNALIGLTDGKLVIETKEELVGTHTSAAEIKTVGTATLEINPLKFKKPGIYRYAITEDDLSYEGISKGANNTTQYLDAYIINDGKGSYAVKYFVLTSAATKDEKNDGKFENTYTTNEVSVKKIVNGEQSYVEEGEGFNFTITVKPGNPSDEQYCVVKGNEVLSPDTEKTEDGSYKWTVKLNDQETVKIHGLTASDSYTVTEDDYSATGWKTAVSATGSADEDETNTRKAAGSGNDNGNVEVTNTKDAPTPTGIVMDIAPYIIMVAAAGVLAFVFLRRRSYTK